MADTNQAAQVLEVREIRRQRMIDVGVRELFMFLLTVAAAFFGGIVCNAKYPFVGQFASEKADLSGVETDIRTLKTDNGNLKAELSHLKWQVEDLRNTRRPIGSAPVGAAPGK